MHLFKGCQGDCCANNTYYHKPTLAKTTTAAESSNDTTTVASTTTDCDTTKVNVSPTSHPTTNHTAITDPTTMDTTKMPSADTNYTRVQGRPTNVEVIAPTVILFVIVSVLTVSGILFHKHIHRYICTCTKCTRQVSFQDAENPPEYDYAKTAAAPQTPPYNSESSAIRDETVQNPSESSAPTVYSPHRDSKSQEKAPIALVIYSPNTAEEEQMLIRSNLMFELESYKITVSSHDLTCIHGSPSVWLERETKKATVVLCVCNKAFQEEWEGQSQASLPLVQSLKHLIHGTVQSSENLSKYAVVLLDRSHRKYIPTRYLQSDSRQFILTDTKAIARYVLNIPSFEMSSQ